MVEHGINAKALALGGASGIIAFIFGTEEALIFAAFSGALIAMAFTGPRGWFKSCGLLAGGTVSAAFISPLILYYLGDVPARAVAFLVGFSVMHFLPALLDFVKNLPAMIAGKYFN